MIVVLSGPGGVGKGTIADALVAGDPYLRLSRSWTTRSRRPGELEDAYVFVDREHFEQHRRRNGFLEWNEFFGNLYGTPIPDDLGDASDWLLEIDVNGAEQVLSTHPDALLVFIEAPDSAEQEARLVGRGDPPDKVRERLEAAAIERDRAVALGFSFVVNDDLARAVAEIRSRIDQRRPGSGPSEASCC